MWRKIRFGELLDLRSLLFNLHNFVANRVCFNLSCFVAKPVLSPFTHYLCGEKHEPKMLSVEKNDKYQVCITQAKIMTQADSITRAKTITKVNTITRAKTVTKQAQ